MSQKCSAKNKKGKRCGAWAITGGKQCALHADPERAAQMGSKHGRRVTISSLPNTLDLPFRSLKSREDLIKFLEETMNRMRHGPFDLRAAKIIAVLAGIVGKALEPASARSSAQGKASLNAQLRAKRRYLPAWPGKTIEKTQREEREKSGTDPGATQYTPAADPERAADLAYRPLTNTAELIEFVEETMNLVRQGPFDLGAANTLAVLAGILLKAFDQLPASAITGQLYAKPLYVPEWRREEIEKMQNEEGDDGTGLVYD